jgi:hypothetical protein
MLELGGSCPIAVRVHLNYPAHTDQLRSPVRRARWLFISCVVGQARSTKAGGESLDEGAGWHKLRIPTLKELARV